MSLTPFAEKMLIALQSLTQSHEPHDCGGFTMDDIETQLKIAFTPESIIWDAIDELTDADLIRYAGDDYNCGDVTCYELVPIYDSAP